MTPWACFIGVPCTEYFQMIVIVKQNATVLFHKCRHAERYSIEFHMHVSRQSYVCLIWYCHLYNMSVSLVSLTSNHLHGTSMATNSRGHFMKLQTLRFTIGNYYNCTNMFKVTIYYCCYFSTWHEGIAAEPCVEILHTFSSMKRII